MNYKIFELNDLIENKEVVLKQLLEIEEIFIRWSKQRIGIQKSTKPFQVLIFDEATSNIDAITENKIIHNLLHYQR